MTRAINGFRFWRRGDSQMDSVRKMLEKIFELVGAGFFCNFIMTADRGYAREMAMGIITSFGLYSIFVMPDNIVGYHPLLRSPGSTRSVSKTMGMIPLKMTRVFYCRIQKMTRPIRMLWTLNQQVFYNMTPMQVQILSLKMILAWVLLYLSLISLCHLQPAAHAA